MSERHILPGLLWSKPSKIRPGHGPEEFLLGYAVEERERARFPGDLSAKYLGQELQFPFKEQSRYLSKRETKIQNQEKSSNPRIKRNMSHDGILLEGKCRRLLMGARNALVVFMGGVDLAYAEGEYAVYIQVGDWLAN